MFRYHGPGCYRLLNDYKETIYVGVAKDIDTRFNQHFRWKNSHLKNTNAIKETAKFEIIKTESNGVALDLEQYLINKYKPKYNKRDKSHNINSKVTSNTERYENLEMWQTYYKIREFDEEKIKLTKKQSIMVILAMYLFFISIIILFLKS